MVSMAGSGGNTRLVLSSSAVNSWPIQANECETLLRALVICLVVVLAPRLLAQTNEMARLALISESTNTAVAADVLTAELSARPNVRLLERNEVDKAYREQALSAGSRDFLKMGQMLGADGLLLLGTIGEGTNQFLTARLIAVKPGVVLSAERFFSPIKDPNAWSSAFADHLEHFLPKLTVLVKDAIPVSIVNLRSARSSADASETERQLKLLAIQRLSSERRIFVLERQRMQALSEEKELKLEDSAFWNGSYLLDGTIDQNGFSTETLTINARLTPPKGGVPIQFEISGSRTNLGSVVNQLAREVTRRLQIQANAPEWKPFDEAAKFFEEARWAMRWGVLAEAESAADAAWALGKTDADCACLRVESYLAELSTTVGHYQKSDYTLSPGYNREGQPLGPPPDDGRVQSAIRGVFAEHRFKGCYSVVRDKSARVAVISFVFADAAPGSANLDRAMHLLELYYNISRNRSVNGLEASTPEANSQNQKWKNLGIQALVAAGQVLQNFNFIPESQEPVAAGLGELRAQARLVVELISKSPSVHDSYFVGERIATRDELAHSVEEGPNLFACLVNWGAYWQETPEDCVELYRELMKSPVFCYIHTGIWFRDLQNPRLIAWNENDRRRVPMVWEQFVQSLAESTNVLWQLESRALALADASNEADLAVGFTNFFNFMITNGDALAANNVELLYLHWGADSLVGAKTGQGVATSTKESLRQLFYSEYGPKLEAMDHEYWSKTVPARKLLAVFADQKNYLKGNRPYEFLEFVRMFESRNYSPAQALELQPLITVYKSNLVARSKSASGIQKSKLIGAIAQVGLLEKEVDRALHPPAAPPYAAPPAPQQTRAVVAKKDERVATPSGAEETATNVILVKKFLQIPLDGLAPNLSGVVVTAHHWQEDKLVLDLNCSGYEYTFDEKGAWKGTRNVTRPAIAILDPATEQWRVVRCAPVDFLHENHFYHHTALCGGVLFTSEGGQVRRYDSSKREWQVLELTDGGNCELFAVNNRLYAANPNLIFEILDGGKRTRILASNRRQPPVSVLDSQNLGTPALFEGSNHSLRVCAGSKIFTWNGDDWSEVCPTPPASFPPMIFPDAVLFVAGVGNQSPGIWRLPTGSDHVEFCAGIDHRRSLEPRGDPKPSWKPPPGLFLPNLPAASRQSNLYLLVDHSTAQDIVNEQQHVITGRKYLPRNGYHAALLCFSGNVAEPQKLLLRFDREEGCLPLTGANRAAPTIRPGLPPAWLLFSTNYLFCGVEHFDAMLGGRAAQSNAIAIGVWMIGLEQINSEVEVQRRFQVAQQAEADALAKQEAERLLAKYDRNHNGIIDSDEKEEALGDPVFIESELDIIDANHNGKLDAEEVAYFDANNNKILEPNEQAGIDIAQHLMAERLLREFDENRDGLLDMSEFNELDQSTREPTAGPVRPGLFELQDANHDGHIDLAELETYLKWQTYVGLVSRGQSTGRLDSRFQMGINNSADFQQRFKTAAESYWRDPRGLSRGYSRP